MNTVMIVCILNIHSPIHNSDKVIMAKYIIIACGIIFGIMNNIDINKVNKKFSKFNIKINNKNKHEKLDYINEINHNEIHIEEIENVV